MIDFQGSLPPSSRRIHPDKQAIQQRKQPEKLNGAGVLVTEGIRKDDVLNTFFVLVFTGKPSGISGPLDHSESDFLSVEGGWSREYLKKPDIYKPMGPDVLDPQELRDVSDVTVKPFLIAFGKH